MPPLLESKDPNWFFRGDIVLEMFKWGLLKEKTRPFFHKEIFANPQLPPEASGAPKTPIPQNVSDPVLPRSLIIVCWHGNFFGNRRVIRDYLMIFWGGSFHITIFQGILIYGFCQGGDLWQIWNSAGKNFFPKHSAIQDVFRVGKKYSHVRWDDNEKNPALW